MNRILNTANNNLDWLEYAQTRLEEHMYSFDAFDLHYPRQKRTLDEYDKFAKMLTEKRHLSELNKFVEVHSEFRRTREEIAYIIGLFDALHLKDIILSKKPTE